MTTNPDTSYPHADLVRGYIARRGVKTFHVADQDDPTSGDSVCGLNLAELIDAGWARGLRRQGLDLCRHCAEGHNLDDPTPVRRRELSKLTKDELYELAQTYDLDGRSSMTKPELAAAVLDHETQEPTV